MVSNNREENGMDDRPYKLSVGSAAEYEELIAEILFPNNFGLIVSQEKGEGIFEVSVHSLRTGAAEDFDYSKNNNAAKIPLETLYSAIQEAMSELKRLARS
jgi:hypothetical protein